MGTYDTRGGTPISPPDDEPYIPETREEAEQAIVHVLELAAAGKLPASEFASTAADIFGWFCIEFNAETEEQRVRADALAAADYHVEERRDGR